MEKIKVKKRPCNAKCRAKISRLLSIFTDYPPRYFAENLHELCVGQVCVIYEPALDRLGDATILFSGKWVALQIKGELAPSVPLVEKIYSHEGYRAAIVVAEKGVKAFLYGNDVLPASVLEKHPPVENIVSVIDSSDYRIIGFAKYDKHRDVYKNIYDLGIFLRILV